MEGGRTNEALALVTAQVRRRPDSVEAWLALGHVTEASEAYSQAAHAYARVRALRGSGEASAGATLGDFEGPVDGGEEGEVPHHAVPHVHVRGAAEALLEGALVFFAGDSAAIS